MAIALRILGFRKKQSQENLMESLAAFGFHPESFNLNPMIVVKQILIDVVGGGRQDDGVFSRTTIVPLSPLPLHAPV